MKLNELEKYTDDELRTELKRRASERRKHIKRETKYVQFVATVKSVDNIEYTRHDGSVKFKAFAKWKYRITDSSNKLANEWTDFNLKSGCFTRDSAPQIGDSVILRYRDSNSAEVFKVRNAKIVAIKYD
jgi:hypothetical protein